MEWKQRDNLKWDPRKFACVINRKGSMGVNRRRLSYQPLSTLFLLASYESTTLPLFPNNNFSPKIFPILNFKEKSSSFSSSYYTYKVSSTLYLLSLSLSNCVNFYPFYLVHKHLYYLYSLWKIWGFYAVLDGVHIICESWSVIRSQIWGIKLYFLLLYFKLIMFLFDLSFLNIFNASWWWIICHLKGLILPWISTFYSI